MLESNDLYEPSPVRGLNTKNGSRSLPAKTVEGETVNRFFKQSPIGAIAFLLVLALTLPLVADSNGSMSIKNFGQISDHYYRGAQPEGKDYTDLAKFGIKTVINLTNGDGDANEKSMVENAGMKYLQIPMTTHVVPTPAQIADFLKTVNDPASQPVYVHCVGGKHRTGVMTAVYRITEGGWTADQAFQEMKKYKFGADFLHSEFKKFVFDYYSQIARSRSISAPTVVAAEATH